MLGIAEAYQAALGSPVIIPGIELSAHADGQDLDILGYYLDPEHPTLQTELARFHDERMKRARAMVERLNALGIPLAWEAVEAVAGRATISRMHIARAMVKAGYVDDVWAAFNRYLSAGGEAFIPRWKFAPEQAIRLIHTAGGAAVLAHPALVQDYAGWIERLVKAGLDGVEVFHPANTGTVRANLKGLAQRFNLVITGGSDFHTLKDALGGYSPPPGCLRDLRAKREANTFNKEDKR